MENFNIIIFSMPVAIVTKEKLVAIALKHFLEVGIQSLSIKTLTQLTGISTKTVYKLVGNKTELLRCCVYRHYAVLFQEIPKINSKSANAIEAILNAMSWVVSVEFKINPKFYSDLNQYYPQLQDEVLQADNKAKAYFSETIRRGKKEHLILNEIDEEIFWITLQRIYSGISRDKLYSGQNPSIETILNNSIMIFIRGMCTAKGLAVMEKQRHLFKIKP